ncbi:indolepyruvate ferredoxin oxidoreductase family protein [Hoeflea sp.]|uniref:indolepyruvate ferredoxin oxidoreductase family protein n=1 Tax=Hoeflea sp. TaxID=1940281 RepID=UPI003BB0E016
MLTGLESKSASPIEERFTLETGKVHLTGTQALVRVLVDQRRRDIAAGIATGGFVSGYRGSPLGGLDHQLWRSSGILDEHGIVFEPGLNEDLAATSVWGSQLTALNPERTVEGVFGLWYGKGPGVDRSMDAIKHGNAAGTSRWGGVLAVAGDDHGASSSTLAHQSDHAFIAAQMPVLSPADVSEVYRFGLLGYELSRHSGLWVGMTALTEVIEGSASIDISPGSISFPQLDDPGDVHIRWPDTPIAMEARLSGQRMEAVARFAASGAFDKVVSRARHPRLGIVAPGKAALDVVDALRILDLSCDEAADLGISIYKPGLTWPLCRVGLEGFARDHPKLLVIEEKRPVVEDQIARFFYGKSSAPVLIGKQDEANRPLIPQTGVLDTAGLAVVLAERLLEQRPDLEQIAGRLQSLRQRMASRPAPAAPERPPYFCAGCPHNTSTRVPEGSNAMAGIGCHGMASWLPDRKITSMTHMGGEGMHWIGQQPFTSEKHRFQNLGDGTYAHSASLNIRAAVAARSNITFKILYNDAVAMTGGQPVEGGLSPVQIIRQVMAEGVEKVVVVTDDVERYRGKGDLPREVEVHDRRKLDHVQKNLRDIRGVTVLLYDQVCATELRRRRKRGEAERPDLRVVIDERVCEGCGDCHAQSGCIAIEPLETALGRKRRINQSSCNLDTSCLNGFCPSFVTVSGATGTKKTGNAAEILSGTEAVPEPEIPTPDRPYNILLPGVGGTGIVTISQILSTAAHLQDFHATSLDMAGLAQKNGAVTSHVRISARNDIAAAKIPAESADVLIATDVIVAEAPNVQATLSAARTNIIANTDVMPTLSFVFDGNSKSGVDHRLERLRRVSSSLQTISAEHAAVELFGDGIAKNMIMLGYAWQCGLIPLERESIQRAIKINGAAVKMNLDAFEAGRRLAVQHPEDRSRTTNRTSLDETAMIRELTRYQSRRWAERFSSSLEPLRQAEAAMGAKTGQLTGTAARSLFKLMTYKDEYEVARLHADGHMNDRLRSMFEGDLKITYHLAPPMLSKTDPATGKPKKIAFGSWIRPVFSLLARMRFLRGTRLDPFGYAEERREERNLIVQFETTIRTVAERLADIDQEPAQRLLALPQEIKGFGHVKHGSVLRYRKEHERLLASLMPERIREETDG